MTIRVEQIKLGRQLYYKKYSIKGIAYSTCLIRNAVRKYLERLALCESLPTPSLPDNSTPEPWILI